MTKDEQLKFAKLMEEEYLVVWYDGKYMDGRKRFGAKEMGFIFGDDGLEDPVRMGGTEAYGDTPLRAVMECFGRRRKK